MLHARYAYLFDWVIEKVLATWLLHARYAYFFDWVIEKVPVT